MNCINPDPPGQIQRSVGTYGSPNLQQCAATPNLPRSIGVYSAI